MRFDHSGPGDFSLVTHLSGSEASSKHGGKSVTAFPVSSNMSDSEVSGVFSNVESRGFFRATNSTTPKLNQSHSSVHFPCSSISTPMAASSGRSAFSCTNKSRRSDVSSQSPCSTSDGEAAALTEHDYIGLAEAASAYSERRFSSGVPDLNIGETELRLGPPKALHSGPDRSNEGGHLESCSGAWDEDRQSYAACREQISHRGEGLVSCSAEFAADHLQTSLGACSRPCEKAEVPRDSSKVHSAPQVAVTGAKRGFSEAICGQFAEESAFAENISTPIAPINRSVADVETKHMRSRLMPPVYPWRSMNQMHTSRPMDLDQSKVPFQPFSSARSLHAQQKSNPSGEAGASADLKDSSAKSWDTYIKRASDSSRGTASVSDVLYGRKECPEMPGDDSENAPASSASVVGWPPVQSFRNKALATQTQPKPMNENRTTFAVTPTGKTSRDLFFVKVYMDGVEIGRKVDLTNCNSYEKLSFLLEEMFRRFILGNGRVQNSLTGNIALVKENKERSLFQVSEYVLTYKDKDGDWMLVGDVPWSMFMGTVKRLRIMKGSDAIGLAPKASEKEHTMGQC